MANGLSAPSVIKERNDEVLADAAIAEREADKELAKMPPDSPSLTLHHSAATARKAIHAVSKQGLRNQERIIDELGTLATLVKNGRKEPWRIIGITMTKAELIGALSLAAIVITYLQSRGIDALGFVAAIVKACQTATP